MESIHNWIVELTNKVIFQKSLCVEISSNIQESPNCPRNHSLLVGNNNQHSVIVEQSMRARQETNKLLVLPTFKRGIVTVGGAALEWYPIANP